MCCGHIRNLNYENFFLHVFIHLYENLHQQKFPTIRYLINSCANIRGKSNFPDVYYCEKCV